MIRNRSMPIQVLLFCVTFGIYSIYWFYAVVCELQEATGDSEASPALWTVLLFVPFAHIYWNGPATIPQISPRTSTA